MSRRKIKTEAHRAERKLRYLGKTKRERHEEGGEAARERRKRQREADAAEITGEGDE